MNTVIRAYSITFYGQIRVIIQQSHKCLDLASITIKELYLYGATNHLDVIVLILQPCPLFSKIEESTAQALKKQFAGKQRPE